MTDYAALSVAASDRHWVRGRARALMASRWERPPHPWDVPMSPRGIGAEALRRASISPARVLVRGNDAGPQMIWHSASAASHRHEATVGEPPRSAAPETPARNPWAAGFSVTPTQEQPLPGNSATPCPNDGDRRAEKASGTPARGSVLRAGWSPSPVLRGTTGSEAALKPPRTPQRVGASNARSPQPVAHPWGDDSVDASGARPRHAPSQSFTSEQSARTPQTVGKAHGTSAASPSPRYALMDEGMRSTEAAVAAERDAMRERLGEAEQRVAGLLARPAEASLTREAEAAALRSDLHNAYDEISMLRTKLRAHTETIRDIQVASPRRDGAADTPDDLPALRSQVSGVYDRHRALQHEAAALATALEAKDEKIKAMLDGVAYVHKTLHSSAREGHHAAADALREELTDAEAAVAALHAERTGIIMQLAETEAELKKLVAKMALTGKRRSPSPLRVHQSVHADVDPAVELAEVAVVLAAVEDDLFEDAPPVHERGALVTRLRNIAAVCEERVDAEGARASELAEAQRVATILAEENTAVRSQAEEALKAHPGLPLRAELARAASDRTELQANLLQKSDHIDALLAAQRGASAPAGAGQLRNQYDLAQALREELAALQPAVDLQSGNGGGCVVDARDEALARRVESLEGELGQAAAALGARQGGVCLAEGIAALQRDKAAAEAQLLASAAPTPPPDSGLGEAAARLQGILSTVATASGRDAAPPSPRVAAASIHAVLDLLATLEGAVAAWAQEWQNVMHGVGALARDVALVNDPAAFAPRCPPVLEGLASDVGRLAHEVARLRADNGALVAQLTTDAQPVLQIHAPGRHSPAAESDIAGPSSRARGSPAPQSLCVVEDNSDPAADVAALHMKLDGVRRAAAADAAARKEHIACLEKDLAVLTATAERSTQLQQEVDDLRGNAASLEAQLSKRDAELAALLQTSHADSAEALQLRREQADLAARLDERSGQVAVLTEEARAAREAALVHVGVERELEEARREIHERDLRIVRLGEQMDELREVKGRGDAATIDAVGRAKVPAVPALEDRNSKLPSNVQDRRVAQLTAELGHADSVSDAATTARELQQARWEVADKEREVARLTKQLGEVMSVQSAPRVGAPLNTMDLAGGMRHAGRSVTLAGDDAVSVQNAQLTREVSEAAADIRMRDDRIAQLTAELERIGGGAGSDAAADGVSTPSRPPVSASQQVRDMAQRVDDLEGEVRLCASKAAVHHQEINDARREVARLHGELEVRNARIATLEGQQGGNQNVLDAELERSRGELSRLSGELQQTSAALQQARVGMMDRHITPERRNAQSPGLASRTVLREDVKRIIATMKADHDKELKSIRAAMDAEREYYAAARRREAADQERVAHERAALAAESAALRVEKPAQWAREKARLEGEIATLVPQVAALEIEVARLNLELNVLRNASRATGGTPPLPTTPDGAGEPPWASPVRPSHLAASPARDHIQQFPSTVGRDAAQDLPAPPPPVDAGPRAGPPDPRAKRSILTALERAAEDPPTLGMGENGALREPSGARQPLPTTPDGAGEPPWASPVRPSHLAASPARDHIQQFPSARPAQEAPSVQQFPSTVGRDAAQDLPAPPPPVDAGPRAGPPDPRAKRPILTALERAAEDPPTLGVAENGALREPSGARQPLPRPRSRSGKLPSDASPRPSAGTLREGNMSTAGDSISSLVDGERKKPGACGTPKAVSEPDVYIQPASTQSDLSLGGGGGKAPAAPPVTQEFHGAADPAAAVSVPSLVPDSSRSATGAEDGLAAGECVARNPRDWEWGNQDGGEGEFGTVLSCEEGWAEVTWFKTGVKNSYRWGHDSKYDLRVVGRDAASGRRSTSPRVGTGMPSLKPPEDGLTSRTAPQAALPPSGKSPSRPGRLAEKVPLPRLSSTSKSPPTRSQNAAKRPPSLRSRSPSAPTDYGMKVPPSPLRRTSVVPPSPASATHLPPSFPAAKSPGSAPPSALWGTRSSTRRQRTPTPPGPVTVASYKAPAVPKSPSTQYLRRGSAPATPTAPFSKGPPRSTSPAVGHVPRRSVLFQPPSPRSGSAVVAPKSPPSPGIRSIKRPQSSVKSPAPRPLSSGSYAKQPPGIEILKGPPSSTRARNHPAAPPLY